MYFSQPFALKLFLVFLFLSLHSSFAWGMEQEDKSVYTHSHTGSKIKALYIDENALLFIEDKGNRWDRKVIQKEDDKYLQLLKSIYSRYPEKDSINHLMVGIEALFINSGTQTGNWKYWYLSGTEGEIKDFCNKPQGSSRYLIDKKEIFISPASKITKAENDKRFSPDKFRASYPKLSFLNTEFILPTCRGHPHSEIQALDALFKINYGDLFMNIPQEKNTLQALVIKFYSFNDICDHCQSAIQEFIPDFQAALKEQLGRKEENIPITIVGVASHCYSSSHYCNYTEEKRECVKFDELTFKNMGLSPFLKEGTCWESLEQSNYNTCEFDLLSCKNYKPFSGNIPLLKQAQDPALYIYIKQPTIRGLEEHVKPEFLELFGIF